MGASYGSSLGDRLGASARSFVARALPRSMIAVTRLRYAEPTCDLSIPPSPEPAFMAAVHFRLFERYRYWEDGRAAPESTIAPGQTIIYDLARRPTFHLNSAYRSVHFYLPVATLHALAEEAGSARVDALCYRPGAPHSDPVLRKMAEALLPAFSRPSEVSQLFMDHAMLAVGHHLAATYGGMTKRISPPRGGLSGSQHRRATEFMRANLSANVALGDVAAQCGLSLSQFSKAFRTSVGEPPYRWLVRQRIAEAKARLCEGTEPLAVIALACGFADQSHFTRVFTAWVGVSPGAWRRAIWD